MFTFPKFTAKFQPKAGATYRFIGVPTSQCGNLALKIGRRVWAGSKADASRLAIGNVFGSLEEAKAVRTKIVDALVTANKPAIPQTIVQNGHTYRLA